jgi:hypothetical protein
VLQHRHKPPSTASFVDVTSSHIRPAAFIVAFVVLLALLPALDVGQTQDRFFPDHLLCATDRLSDDLIFSSPSYSWLSCTNFDLFVAQAF